MSLGESCGVGMEGWLTVDFFVAAGEECRSEGGEKEERTKVERRRKGKGEEKLQMEHGVGGGGGWARGWEGHCFLGTPSAPKTQSIWSQGHAEGNIFALPVPLLLTSIVKTKLFSIICKHKARQGCGDLPILTKFPKRAGHSQAERTWP